MRTPILSGLTGSWDYQQVAFDFEDLSFRMQMVGKEKMGLVLAEYLPTFRGDRIQTRREYFFRSLLKATQQYRREKVWEWLVSNSEIRGYLPEAVLEYSTMPDEGIELPIHLPKLPTGEAQESELLSQLRQSLHSRISGLAILRLLPFR